MNKTEYNYPIAPSKPVTENYFGTKITDHYRNLEDLKDPAVQKWYKAQGVYAENILENIPGRDTLIKKMEDFNQRQAYSVFNINVTRDDQCFFLKKQKGAETAQVFYRKDEHSEDELLYDPKEYKPETQKNYIIQNISPSWDGRYLVIAITHSGLEITEMDAYLQLQEGVEYPATLITAGMNDPRVSAWQTGKFAAKLQVYNASNKPTIFWVDYESGHGVGSTESQVIKKFANIFSFAFWQLGHPV